VNPLFVRLPEVPFAPEEVWFVPEDLMQPYAVVVLNVLVSRNVAATRITIPVDKNNRFTVVLFWPTISAYLLCFTNFFIT
jgi:hypothetical protein